MTKDYVTVDLKQSPIYVTGERLPKRDNIGEALKDLESAQKKGLVALTGITGAKARIVAPNNDKIHDCFTAFTGVYKVEDYEGRFGKKRKKVNVVSHGLGHPLDNSQRVKRAFETEYTKKNGIVKLSREEEIELLSEEGTPIFTYDEFLERTEDPNFLRANPSLRIVRTQDVIQESLNGMHLLDALYEDSSIQAYLGGRTPVQIITPQGEKTVTVAQALVDKTGERFSKNHLGVWLHNTGGGRLLVFGEYAYDYLVGYHFGFASFIMAGAGSTKEDLSRSRTHESGGL